MNIFVFSKSEVIDINKEYNNIYTKKSDLINQILYFFKIRNKKDIQIIVNVDYEINVIFSILKIIFRLPLLNLKKTDKEVDLEKLLQHEIAYRKQRDIPVLMYHRVITSDEEKGVYDTAVTLKNFENQMRYLREHNFEIITFKDLQNGKYKERFNKKYVIITFDDGYKDNYHNALPILKKYNIPIVLYLVSDSKYNEWDVNIKNRPKEKIFQLMDKKELGEMKKSGLVEFGGHTRRHLNMKNSDEKLIEEDLKISKEIVERLAREKLVSFAYPWGANNELAQNIVKKMGYQFAVSTESGTACFSDNLYEIKRVGIYYKDDMKKFIKKVSGHYTFMQENRDNRKKFRNKLRRVLGLKEK